MNSAPQGLIHAKLLDGAGGALDLDWSDVRRWNVEQGCLWLHLDYEQEEASRWIREESGLNDIAVNGLLTAETRPRAISRGDNLLLALRGVNLNPGSEPDDMVSVRIWTDGKRVISTRRRTLQSTRDILQELDEGVGPESAADLLVAWADRIVERMGGTVDNFEDRVAEAEERLLAGDIEGLRFDLAQLRKQAIVIRRYLAPQREAMNRLVTEPLSWLDEMNRLRLREVNDRQSRHIEDIDAVRERAAMAHDEMLGQVSEEMNKRSYVFTVVATVFLPLGFFTGLMGINVGGMPGVDDNTAFWIVVGICLGLTGLLGVLFRLKRWL
jgi:zinc transporter